MPSYPGALQASPTDPNADTTLPSSAESTAATQAPTTAEYTINGRVYVGDISSEVRRTLPTTKDRIVEQSETNEFSLNDEGIWTRSQTTWHYGAGQKYFDDEELGGDRRRFRDSLGVDPWSPGVLKPLPAIEVIDSFTGIDPWRVQFQRVNGTVAYIGDNESDTASSFYYLTDTSDPNTGANWNKTSLGATGKTFISWCAVEQTGYAARGDRRPFKGDVTTTITWTELTAGTGARSTERIWFLKGSLIGAQTGAIFEWTDSAGAMDVTTGTTFNHPSNDGGWVAAVEAPNAILLMHVARWTDETSFYMWFPDSSGGLTDDPIKVGGLPTGERGYTMIVHRDLVLIGSSEGIRVASFSGDSVNGTTTLRWEGIIDDPLFEGQNLPATKGIKSLTGHGEYVYFGWEWEGGTSSRITGLGRLHLGRNTTPNAGFTPAFASDVMTASGAVTGTTVRAYGNSENPTFTDGEVTSIVTLSDGTPIFHITNSGIWAPKQTYSSHNPGTDMPEHAPSMQMYSGKVRFGSLHPKVYTAMAMSTEELKNTADGQTITAQLVNYDVHTGRTEAGGVVSSGGTVSLDGSRYSGVLPFATVQRGVEAEVRIDFGATDVTPEQPGPHLLAWSLYGYPTPPCMEEIIITVDLSEQAADKTGAPRAYDFQAEWNWLTRLKESGEIVNFQAGTRTDVCRVSDVGYPVGEADPISADPDGWRAGKIQIRLLTMGAYAAL